MQRRVNYWVSAYETSRWGRDYRELLSWDGWRILLENLDFPTRHGLEAENKFNSGYRDWKFAICSWDLTNIQDSLNKTGNVRYESRNFTLLKLNGARGNLASIGQQTVSERNQMELILRKFFNMREFITNKQRYQPWSLVYQDVKRWLNLVRQKQSKSVKTQRLKDNISKEISTQFICTYSTRLKIC